MITKDKSHLCSNRATNIHELYMRELLLYLCNLRVRQCTTNESLERADGVPEIGGFERLRSLSN